MVLAFALAITLATALVFGAIPVVRSRRTDPAIALDEGGRGGGCRVIKRS